MKRNAGQNKSFVVSIKPNQRIRVITNHIYAGHCGVVEDVEYVDSIEAIFDNGGCIEVKLDSGERIILRPGQYEAI